MTRFRKFIFITAYPLILWGCVDDIQLEVKGKDEFVVINGQITNLVEPYQVTIFKSAKLFIDELDDPEPISNALVTIGSSDSNSIVLTESEPGTYTSIAGTFIGCIGESYFINIKMEDGREYQSIPEPLLPVSPITSVYFDYLVEDELNETGFIVQKARVKVFVDTQVPMNTRDVFLKWDVKGEYQFNEWEPPGPFVVNSTCYVPDDLPLGEVKILDGSNANNNLIKRKEIKSLDVNYKFASIYCLHIRQQSLSAGAYNFWQQISKSVDRSGGLFEEPAGTLRGNISNVNDPTEQVLGYFQVSAVDIKRVFVQKEATHNPVAPCPPEDIVLQEACGNCLTLKNSSFQKPSYWP